MKQYLIICILTLIFMKGVQSDNSTVASTGDPSLTTPSSTDPNATVTTTGLTNTTTIAPTVTTLNTSNETSTSTTSSSTSPGPSSSTTVSPVPTSEPAGTTGSTAADTGEEPTYAPRVSSHQFHAPSFIGGIVLALGLMAISYVGFKYYKSRTGRNYHTLQENLHM